jgi:SAM-dependent methyltransferase
MSVPAHHGKVESTIDRIYQNRFPPGERQAKRALWEAMCASFFVPRYVRPGDTVLDLGAGYCDFINHVPAAHRVAVDINPDTPDHAADGVEVLSVPLESLADAMPADGVDLAFASNVFEHLRGPDVLLAVLEAVRSVLRPGGRIVVMQPNVRVLGGAFWDFFDHTLPLSERGMAEALVAAGFTIDECHARFLPYTTKGWLPTSPALARLYLALPPVWRLLGKQMLVVARKPA